MLQEYYALSLPEFGLMLGIGGISGCIGTFVIGILLTKREPLALLFPVLWGLVAGMGLAALGWRYELMLFAVAVTGAFASALAIMVPVILVKVYPQQHRRALALQLAVSGFCGMLFPLVVEGLFKVCKVQPSIGFAYVFHIPLGCLCLVLATITLLLGHKKDKIIAQIGMLQTPRAPSSLSTGFKLFRSGFGGCTLLLWLLILHSICDSSIGTWFPTVIDSGCFTGDGVPPGIILSAVSGTYLISRILLGLIPEEMGKDFGMFLPGILGGTVMLLGILSLNPLLLGGAYILGAFLWSVEFPILLATLAKEHPNFFGAAMAINSIVTSFAMLPIGLGIGKFGELLGNGQMWMVLLPFACGFICVGIGGGLWLFTKRADVRRLSAGIRPMNTP